MRSDSDIARSWLAGVRRQFAALSVAFCVLLIGAATGTSADEIVVEKTYFRNRIDGRIVRLEGLVVKRADLTGRLPVALITHGKSSNLGGMLDSRATHYVGPAQDLARRGWLAVVVMRRGFGQSDGPMAAPVSCATTTFADRFAADADDLQATLDSVAKRPDADPDRAIAIGVSAGGASVVALAARNPTNLRGAISISGGIRMPDCPKEDVLVNAYKDFGLASRVPHLWIYARNDSFFAPALVERMQSAFLDGGGDVKLVMFDAFGKDGHALFGSPGGRRQWLMEMDGFLRFHDLPTWTRQHVSNLMKTMKADERERSFVERYIAAPTFKAMAQAPGTNSRSSYHGASSLDVARRGVLEGCQKRHKTTEPCAIIMENDTWLGQKPADSDAM